ncbi:fumarylacetoacetate hydrolase family protein [Gilvimarinus polysaccharolyticus]|uniref:fumarylacetoacetate hydrolase family protein n=1 Tax=Gilvimarinus polysaccharolyticus TaxID=863921 RepID=UPI0006738C50|nr:fumarylacetoacetate hydrolase family protein [Gilvimarinus polysaccharolyticus]
MPTLAIAGSNTPMPVARIICIGRNYREHAREMGHDPARATPFFFFKPTSALLPQGREFTCPWYSHQVDHEVELVIAIDRKLQNANLSQAQDAICGFAVGLDMTCRDIQREAKAQGRPWELAKGFDGSAPCSALQPGRYADLKATDTISLSVNGKITQQASWRDMIWAVPELIVELSRYTTLTPGDLLFTGTPAGVGPVVPGDILEAKLDDVCHLSVVVAKPAAR